MRGWAEILTLNPLTYVPRWSQGADERLDLVQVFAGASYRRGYPFLHDIPLRFWPQSRDTETVERPMFRRGAAESRH
jgi:hypothetical protein